jgi:hypothetical protein
MVTTVAGAPQAISRATAPVARTDRPLTAPPVDALSSAGGSTVRTLPRGREVRIVPRSICSTQVASARPPSPALCVSITPEEATELGLNPGLARAPSAGGGLPLTGASIAALAVAGLLSLGIGGAVRPLRRSRAALA